MCMCDFDCRYKLSECYCELFDDVLSFEGGIFKTEDDGCED